MRFTHQNPKYPQDNLYKCKPKAWKELQSDTLSFYKLNHEDYRNTHETYVMVDINCLRKILQSSRTSKQLKTKKVFERPDSKLH